MVITSLHVMIACWLLILIAMWYFMPQIEYYYEMRNYKKGMLFERIFGITTTILLIGLVTSLIANLCGY